ncbi:MAG: EAL domain-containing protein [Betaproteobacteria bacterium]|nr:EAL domain-containing protein [Betaproteobacteria bacterium]
MVAIQVIALGLITTANRQIARESSTAALQRGERIFQRLQQQSQAQLEQGAAILSADFAFREAVATNDTATIASALRNHGARAKASAMMLISLERVVLADTLLPERVNTPFAYPDLIKEAEKDGKSSATVSINDVLFQLVVVPVLAPDPIAWVGLGYQVDDATARELQQLSGMDVTIASAGSAGAWILHATTLPEPLKADLLRHLQARGTLLPNEIDLVGETYETRVTSLPTGAGNSTITILQRPLAEGLLPFQRLNSAFFWLALASVALTIVGSAVIARKITDPINRLALAADKIHQGDYSSPIVVEQQDEIGTLAASFDQMRDGIASREKEIRRLAYRDGLTGLDNRAMFQERLEQVIRIAKRGGSYPSVLLLDLDRFKAINDTLGHPVGDMALKEIGQRLVGTLRASDSVARLGGDEFAILLPTGDATHVGTVARKVQTALEAPIVIEGQSMDLGASIGIAYYPLHGEDVTALMRSADIAMYVAKHEKSGYAVFDPSYDEDRKSNLTLLGELRRAVENNELCMLYQPQLKIELGRMTAVEALVRWHHPAKGLVGPGEFIPFAEHTGSIGIITRWVVAAAVEQCGYWHRAGLSLRVSINISARDLREREGLPAFIAEALRANTVPAGLIGLEITESALMEDPAGALATLERLHALGVTLSVDDYGTGYSSLAYLKELAVNELKIDQTFVMGMESDRQNLAIVRSTIELGHNLGLSVVAEGVETEFELRALTRLGCDFAQGYWIGRPMPVDELEAWLRAAHPA